MPEFTYDYEDHCGFVLHMMLAADTQNNFCDKCNNLCVFSKILRSAGHSSLDEMSLTVTPCPRTGMIL